jgi:hypothetical protein
MSRYQRPCVRILHHLGVVPRLTSKTPNQNLIVSTNPYLIKSFSILYLFGRKNKLRFYYGIME